MNGTEHAVRDGDGQLRIPSERWAWLKPFMVAAVDRLVERYGDEHGAASG